MYSYVVLYRLRFQWVGDRCPSPTPIWNWMSYIAKFGKVNAMSNISVLPCTLSISRGGGAGHTSISLTGMLVREQISTTQKNTMTLNLNPKRVKCPKIQTQKNRMTQYPVVVKVWINMKSYYDFVFQYCVFFVQSIQVCDTKIGRPKKIAGNLSDPKK